MSPEPGDLVCLDLGMTRGDSGWEKTMSKDAGSVQAVHGDQALVLWSKTQGLDWQPLDQLIVVFRSTKSAATG